MANSEGYAHWSKFESYLNLDAEVQEVIQAAKTGQLEKLRVLLAANPGAANPRWVGVGGPVSSIPNDSIPLFCVSEGIFNGTNRNGNDYEIASVLIRTGADVEIEGGAAADGCGQL